MSDDTKVLAKESGWAAIEELEKAKLIINPAEILRTVAKDPHNRIKNLMKGCSIVCTTVTLSGLFD